MHCLEVIGCNLHFYPHDAVVVQYWPCVCQSVTSREFYQNSWMEQAGFWLRG